MLLILLHFYFVSFMDKPEKTAPALSPRATEQRVKWSIPTDELDYPVSTLYLDSLRDLGATVCHTSRWFNGATCAMSDSVAARVSRLAFVKNIEMTRDDSNSPAHLRKRMMAVNDAPSSKQTDAQLDLYNLRPLHEAGFEGRGILITVCDCGFYNADTLSCFRQDSLELGHFDFSDEGDDFYGERGSHGTMCLSVISGIKDDFYGAATQAQYYLMRTEENLTESPKELDNLVAALEKADSLGTNIFTSSLGYFDFDNSEWNLPKSALDGRTTRVSIAATIAARKGMLVCIAAGNEGNKTWHSIGVPADADSILTVGAVGVDSIIGDFSGYGPSADGRVKPEVCAVGVQTTLIRPSGNISTANGTSFATPLLAGMAACLWSALPDENAMQIRERIIRSAHLYPNYDPKYQMGYGIPDAWKAYTHREEGLDNKKSDDTKCTKILRGGRVCILRNGQIYDITGRQVK